jgi:hypothetical protein
MRSAPSISIERSKIQNLSIKKAFALASPGEPFYIAFNQGGIVSDMLQKNLE